MKKLYTSAILEGVNPRKDKSVSIRFSTNEKTPKEIGELCGFLDQFGYLVFKTEERLTEDELAQVDELNTDLYDKPKTQSQRLRNVLYLLWKEDDKGFLEFKDYYANQTDIIIKHFKSKLP